VQHQVFEMDELAVDPQRGAGVGDACAQFYPCPYRGAGDMLVKTRQRDADFRNRPQ
jgi:hypothetical protein